MDLASYISGYVDGEGCFCVPFCVSKRHRLGWDVRPSFSVSQNRDRSELLYAIQNYWKCGFVRPDRSDQTLKYEVRSIGDLVGKVLPHFREFPLQSSKQKDVETFDMVCHLVRQKRHLDVEGLEQIIRLAMQMNPSGKRKYTGSVILNSLHSGEGIVCATGNRGLTRSSDLHEWRNDRSTVSTTDPVKL